MRGFKPDVLVVGAGPVGLTMAAELARHGVLCRIIDQLAAPLPYCRAIGVTPRTLEVWDDMGIITLMIDAGLWIDRTRRYLNHSPAQDEVRDFSDLPYSSLGIPQPETERILTAHLATFGIAVGRPVTLTSFTQDSDGVNVELTRPDGTIQKASFQYIIGCDGARSAVRRILDIPFEGDHYPVGFMLGDVVLDLDLPRGMSLWAINAAQQGPPDFFIAIPLPARNRYRVSMLASPDSSDISAPAHGLQTPSGPAVVASMTDMGDRFRLIVNEVDVIQPDEPLPKLPVARAVWLPKPNLKIAAAAWIYAGGAHHTGFSQALTTEHLEDFAEIAGIELIVIDAETRLRELRRQLR